MPPFRATSTRSRSLEPITIRQLATLASGVPEIMAYRADNSVGLVAADEEARLGHRYAAPMEFEPGRGYNYVQTNYALLGKVIDRLEREAVRGLHRRAAVRRRWACRTRATPTTTT